MSGTSQGEWFADYDGQWTWRQPDGSCWREGEDGAWHEFAAVPSSTVSLPHPGPPPVASTSDLASGEPSLVVGHLPDAAPMVEGNGSVGGHHPLGDYQADSRVKRETSAMAVWALVLGVLNLCYIGAILAIVIGAESLHHIKHSRGSLRGKTPAILAILVGLAWLVTIPLFVVPNLINLYHSARTTTQDAVAKTSLKTVLNDGVNNLYQLRHSYAGITASSMPQLPLVHFVESCGSSGICLASGSGFGYTYVQMCQATSSHHAWIVSQTSGSPAWFGEAANACPPLGDPGTSTDQPSQAASWERGGFPPATFDVTLIGHHFHWKL